MAHVLRRRAFLVAILAAVQDLRLVKGKGSHQVNHQAGDQFQIAKQDPDLDETSDSHAKPEEFTSIPTGTPMRRVTSFPSVHDTSHHRFAPALYNQLAILRDRCENSTKYTQRKIKHTKNT